MSAPHPASDRASNPDRHDGLPFDRDRVLLDGPPSWPTRSTRRSPTCGRSRSNGSDSPKRAGRDPRAGWGRQPRVVVERIIPPRRRDNPRTPDSERPDASEAVVLRRRGHWL